MSLHVLLSLNAIISNNLEFNEGDKMAKISQVTFTVPTQPEPASDCSLSLGWLFLCQHCQVYVP